MGKDKLLQYLENFKNKKILVLGDIMLDKYIFGDVNRISPEAPVPVLSAKSEKFVPGGAGNSANNLAVLGADVFLAGVVGNDKEKEMLFTELKKRNINTDAIIPEESRPTTIKTRVVAMTQQLLRIDHEKKDLITGKTAEKILNFIKGIIQTIDSVIISDYTKGVCSEELVKQVIQLCNQNKKPVIVDTKTKNYFIYKNCTLITPSHTDAAGMTKIDENSEEDLLRIGRKFQQDLNCNVLITRGKNGMTIFEGPEIATIPTKAKEVYDVSGAGDTVVAVLALALCSGASLEESAFLATYAASVVISKLGTATVAIDEIKRAIKNDE